MLRFKPNLCQFGLLAGLAMSGAGCRPAPHAIVAADAAAVNAPAAGGTRAELLALVAARDHDRLFAERPRLEQLATGEEAALAAAAFAALMTVDGYIDPAWELAWTSSGGFTNLLAAMPLLVDSPLRIALAERAMPLLDDEELALLSGWQEADRVDARRAIIAALAHVAGREAQIHAALEAAQQDPALREAARTTLAQVAAPQGDRALASSRQLVERYTTAAVESALQWPAGSRSFARGRRVYHELGCHRCHLPSDHDTLVGPNLLADSYRASRRELLEAVLEPDKEIADSYRQYMLVAGGKPITGLVTEQTDDYLVVIADPLHDCTPQRIERDDLDDDPQPIVASAMPTGMVDVLSVEELLDLVAYLEAKASPRDPSFRQQVPQ